MEQTIQKPATDVIKSVDQITINVKSRQVIVRVTTTEPEGTPVSNKVVFDIVEFLNDEGYSATQKTGIKLLFRQMIAKAWGLLESELTGEVFPVDEVVEEPPV